MKNLFKKYNNKFNTNESKVKIDKSWDRYYNNESSISHERIRYCASKLYGKVIDVGSGDGFGAYLMQENKKIEHISCIEIQESAIIRAKNNLKEFNNIEIINGIGEDLIFVDNYFDSAFCGETLEHVFDDMKTISEIHRVVKDVSVFTVPIKGGISLQHVREYKGEDEIKNKLTKYFNIVEVKNFFDEKINLLRVCLVCRKK